jgi:hypothetical protein
MSYTINYICCLLQRRKFDTSLANSTSKLSSRLIFGINMWFCHFKCVLLYCSFVFLTRYREFIRLFLKGLYFQLCRITMLLFSHHKIWERNLPINRKEFVTFLPWNLQIVHSNFVPVLYIIIYLNLSPFELT